MMRTVLVFFAACATEPPCPSADLAPLPTAPAYAVVTSDWQSTAIALLDEDGVLVTEAWIDSGTTRAGIVATLTGDVSLPTAPWPGEIVLLDRFGVDVITRIAVPSGEVLGQVPIRAEPRGGYRPNPQDVVRLDDRTALVSRHERNADPSAPELDRGNDLVLIDLVERALTARIDLSHLDVPDGEDTILARPARMARVGEHVVVGLARLGALCWRAGPGAVAVVDPAARSATELPLEGLRGCGAVRPMEGDAESVVVLCAGDSFEGGEGCRLRAASDETRRAHAGLAIVRVGPDGAAEVTHVWRASEHPDAPVPTSSLVSLGGTRAVFAAWGEHETGRADRAVAVDLGDGSFVSFLSSEPFAIGSGHFATEQQTLFLADASRGIRRVHMGAEIDELEPTPVSPCRSLLARELTVMVPR